jgi:RsiW-degrading membrane proteinase PrsW (M82 family)
MKLRLAVIVIASILVVLGFRWHQLIARISAADNVPLWEDGSQRMQAVFSILILCLGGLLLLISAVSFLVSRKRKNSN